MSCREYQEMLALRVSGDLPAHQARRLEAHLQSCGECRALEPKLREGRQALLGLAAAEEAPASIRGQVMERVADERRPVAWFPGWKLAGAAAAAIVVLALVLSQLLPGPETAPLSADAEPALTAEPPPVPPATPVTPAAVEEPAPEPAVQEAEQPVPPEPVPAVRPTAPQGPEPETTAPPESVVVKMLTDDPDVVIYMLVNGEEGDTEDA